MGRSGRVHECRLGLETLVIPIRCGRRLIPAASTGAHPTLVSRSPSLAPHKLPPASYRPVRSAPEEAIPRRSLSGSVGSDLVSVHRPPLALHLECTLGSTLLLCYERCGALRSAPHLLHPLTAAHSVMGRGSLLPKRQAASRDPTQTRFM